MQATRSSNREPALKGGVPAISWWPGFPRWSFNALCWGLAVSGFVHLLAYVTLMAIPWEVWSIPGPDGDYFPGGKQIAFFLVFVVFAAAALRLDRGREGRTHPWALISAVLCFAALLFGTIASHELACIGGLPASKDRPGVFVTVVALFALSALCALLAAISMLRRRGEFRGWVLVAWGLYIPSWFGYAIGGFLLAPLFLVDPDLDEMALGEVGWANGNPILPQYAFGSVRLCADESILLQNEWPAEGDETERWNQIEQFLSDRSKTMRMDLSPEYSDEVRYDRFLPLDVVPDANLDFATLARFARMCQKPGIDLWKLRVRVRRARAPWLGKIALYLPHPGWREEAYRSPPSSGPLRIEVVEEGTRLALESDEAWSGEGPFRYGDDRVLRYRWEDSTTEDLDELMAIIGDEIIVLSDMGSGVLWGDVARVIDALDIPPGIACETLLHLP